MSDEMTNVGQDPTAPSAPSVGQPEGQGDPQSPSQGPLQPPPAVFVDLEPLLSTATEPTGYMKQAYERGYIG